MKKFLIVMALVTLVSDYLLHLFYAQFFEIRFGLTNSVEQYGLQMLSLNKKVNI